MKRVLMKTVNEVNEQEKKEKRKWKEKTKCLNLNEN